MVRQTLIPRHGGTAICISYPPTRRVGRRINACLATAKVIRPTRVAAPKSPDTPHWT